MRVRGESGTLKVLDEGLRPVWEVDVGQPLFALREATLPGAARPVLVACTWDGLTLLIDADRHAVQYQFTDAVCAFCAGPYARAPGDNAPALLYVDYEDRITVFHELSVVGPLAPTTLRAATAEAVARASRSGLRIEGGDTLVVPISGRPAKRMPLRAAVEQLVYFPTATE
jgi:hypothetical protein